MITVAQILLLAEKLAHLPATQQVTIDQNEKRIAIKDTEGKVLAWAASVESLLFEI